MLPSLFARRSLGALTGQRERDCCRTLSAEEHASGGGLK